ncbi:MAG TPA: ABC transporter substrate-binding protein, partial [Thermomicrobiales bacterium]|nr:ABC transporter substrate-binding protein [Thermomicrobiales bacterium]
SCMSPDLPYYFDPKKYPQFKDGRDFSKDKALAALKGSKYEGGKNWPAVKLSYRQEGDIPKTAAQFIQRQLQQNLNMNVELDEQEQNTFRDSMYNRKLQFIFIRWYMDYPDPNDIYKLVFYGKTTSGKRQAWSNDDYDALADQAASEIDPDKRFQLYLKAEQMLMDDGVYAPLWYGYAYDLFKPTVGGIPKTKAGVPQPAWNIFIDDARTIYKKK